MLFLTMLWLAQYNLDVETETVAPPVERISIDHGDAYRRLECLATQHCRSVDGMRVVTSPGGCP